MPSIKSLARSLGFLLMQYSVLAAAETYDSPATDKFLRKTTARGVVLGDYLYIDGGEVSQLTSEGNTQEYRASDGVNSTLSIDLTKSWRSEDVEIRTIPKIAPIMAAQGVFSYDASSPASFYIFGGQTPYGAPVSEPQNWKFVADGGGGGTWKTEDPTNPEIFNELRRSQDGAFVSTPSAGIWIGGHASAWTDFAPDSQPVPGALTFNFTAKTWRNDSTTDFTPSGALRGGNAEYVPSFGPNGLVMMLGGSTSGLDPETQKIESYLDFQNISFFDPVTRDWHWQSTTGLAPSGRRYFCSVGAPGRNGTHEIFVFGGRNFLKSEIYNDMYILSLPGFVWTKVAISEQSRRASHHCVLIGKGQMVSIGGIGKSGFKEKDDFPRGLGIFDMNSLTWGTEFRVDAEEYDSPLATKQWYATGGLDSVQWSSDEVRSLFGAAGNSTNPPEVPPPKSSSSIPVGPIVGGVLGGVALLAIIGAAIFFWSRKGRTKVPQDDHEEMIHQPAQQYHDSQPVLQYQDVAEPKMLYTGAASVTEFHGMTQRPELVGSEPFVSELVGSMPQDGRQDQR